NPGSDPPLTEISARGLDRSAPIRGQPAFTNISMKRRVRPVAGLGDESVLHGIIVDVIDVTDEISFISNRVLPEPSLLQEVLARIIWRNGNPAADDPPCEQAFDPPPSSGKI